MFLRSCSFGYVLVDMFRVCSVSSSSYVPAMFSLRFHLRLVYGHVYVLSIICLSFGYILLISVNVWLGLYLLFRDSARFCLCSIYGSVQILSFSFFVLVKICFWFHLFSGYVPAAMFCWPYFCWLCSSTKTIRGDLQE